VLTAYLLIDVSGVVGTTAANNVVEDTPLGNTVVGGRQVTGATVVEATTTVVGGTDSPSTVEGVDGKVDTACTIGGNAAGIAVPHSGTGTADVVVVATEVPEASGCVVLAISVDGLTGSIVVVVAKLSGAHSSTACVVVVTDASVVDTISATTVGEMEEAVLVSVLVVDMGSKAAGFGEVVVAGARLVEDGPELRAVELETAPPTSPVLTGTELADSDGKVDVVDWVALGNVVEVNGPAATVELGGSGACAASMGTEVATIVLASVLAAAASDVELGGAVVGLATSVGGLEVVVFALPAAGKVEGLCVEFGESVEEGTTLEAGMVGTDCTVATVLLAGVARVAAVEVATEVEVEESGSGQGIATVTESDTSAPFPSETVH
jgi:hypothetical protein